MLPVASVLVLAAVWTSKPGGVALVLLGALLGGSVLAAVRNVASIGLTIPAIAVATIWLEGPLVLGLEATQMVLLAITVVVASLTVLPGRATLQEACVHLVLFAAFLFLAVNP